ncbi:hypothetical protein M408DRAFT_188555 [Serendipita vermifera MAFF 305830]|uniref:Uncharacterized protein n=1 Tax=Serendipita vermifera MAFF 305830 TaxID=933852 RepID=A0A0C2XVH9_SERVB|nr:hypothetical protein M408DRAFT_188555 [Serendipita vermifera MAFF 305830]
MVILWPGVHLTVWNVFKRAGECLEHLTPVKEQFADSEDLAQSTSKPETQRVSEAGLQLKFPGAAAAVVVAVEAWRALYSSTVITQGLNDDGHKSMGVNVSGNLVHTAAASGIAMD